MKSMNVSDVLKQNVTEPIPFNQIRREIFAKDIFEETDNCYHIYKNNQHGVAPDTRIKCGNFHIKITCREDRF